MNRNEQTERQIEERLTSYFNREAEQQEAPADLWESIEPHLPPQFQPMASGGRLGTFARLLTSPIAAAAAVVLLVGGLGVFALTSVGDGEDLFFGGGDPTPTPTQAGSVGNRATSLSQVTINNGASGPQGSAGPTGSPGAPGPAGPILGPAWNAISLPAATPAPALKSAPSIGDRDGSISLTFGATASESDASQRPAIEVVDRQIIATASVGVEVQDVRPALSQLRTIAESLGGFVESLSSSGGLEPQRGTATVRVPRPAFFDALERIKALGSVLNEQVGTEDVTNTIIDLQARLRSEERKEASFLTLLERTSSVSEVLNVERELARVRAEIERIEGQLAFIERRVDLGTIDVSLSVPGAPVKPTIVPPSANVHLDVDDLDDVVSKLRGIGTVTQAVLTVNGGFERATMALHVPLPDFDSTLGRVEALGEVTFKEVRQPGGVEAQAGVDDAAEQPKARIDLTLVQPPSPEASMNYWLVVGAPIGGVAGLLLLGYAAFRLGRRRLASAG